MNTANSTATAQTNPMHDEVEKIIDQAMNLIKQAFALQDKAAPAVKFSPDFSHRLHSSLEKSWDFLDLVDEVNLMTYQADGVLRLVLNYLDGKHGIDTDLPFYGIQSADFIIQDLNAVLKELIARQGAEPNILTSLGLIQGIAARLAVRLTNVTTPFAEDEVEGRGFDREKMSREVESIRSEISTIRMAVDDLWNSSIKSK